MFVERRNSFNFQQTFREVPPARQAPGHHCEEVRDHPQASGPEEGWVGVGGVEGVGWWSQPSMVMTAPTALYCDWEDEGL